MTEVKELVSSAEQALEAGNTLVARGYLRRATGVAPERADLWRALLEVTERPDDRIRCLERIVALDPADAAAEEELQRLLSERAASEAAEAVPSVEPDLPEDDEAPPDAGQAAALDPDASPAPPAPALLSMRADVTDEMRRGWDDAVAAGQPLTCINHAERETSLRCNRCGAPICTSCIVRTPVGFRCRECVQAQQAGFFTGRWYDYLIAAAVSFLLSVPAAALARAAGWWFATIVSPVAGMLIGGIVHRAVGRRRGRWTWLITVIGMVLGALASLLVVGTISICAGIRPSGLYDLPSVAIFAILAPGAAATILRLGRRR